MNRDTPPHFGKNIRLNYFEEKLFTVASFDINKPFCQCKNCGHQVNCNYSANCYCFSCEITNHSYRPYSAHCEKCGHKGTLPPSPFDQTIRDEA